MLCSINRRFPQVPSRGQCLKMAQSDIKHCSARSIGVMLMVGIKGDNEMCKGNFELGPLLPVDTTQLHLNHLKSPFQYIINICNA